MFQSESLQAVDHRLLPQNKAVDKWRRSYLICWRGQTTYMTATVPASPHPAGPRQSRRLSQAWSRKGIAQTTVSLFFFLCARRILRKCTFLLIGASLVIIRMNSVAKCILVIVTRFLCLQKRNKYATFLSASCLEKRVEDCPDSHILHSSLGFSCPPPPNLWYSTSTVNTAVTTQVCLILVYVPLSIFLPEQDTMLSHFLVGTTSCISQTLARLHC